MGCVYKLTFPSGKSYVGMTKHTAEKRFQGHVKQAKEGKPWIVSRAIQKYGAENVVIETLFLHSDHDVLVEHEIKLIALYNTLAPCGYNLTSGGGGCSNLSQACRQIISEKSIQRWSCPDYKKNMIDKMTGRIVPLDLRKKRSERMKGIRPSQKCLDAGRVANTGRPMPPQTKKALAKKHQKLQNDPEYKRKQSQRCKDMWNRPGHRDHMKRMLTGRTHTPETRVKMSKAAMGHPVSAQTRAAVSKASKGRKHTPEARTKMSRAQMGRKHSPETLIKMSEAQKKRFANSPMTSEQKDRMSAARRGRKLSSETKVKISKALKGRKFTPGHRFNLAEANRKRAKREWKEKREQQALEGVQ